jgi:hypothetical protein
VFTGTPTYLIGNGGSPVTTSGTVSITMNIVPASDVGAGDAPGLVLIDANDGSIVTATVSSTGLVTLTNGSVTDTMQFGAPAAAGTAMTLTYNPETDQATLTQSGSFSDNAVITNAFPLQVDTPAVRLGVLSFGGGQFRGLTATGTGIPDLDSTGDCVEPEGEGEGSVEGEPEGSAEGEGEEDPEVVIVGGSFYVAEGDPLALGLLGADGATGFAWRKDGVALPGETGPTFSRLAAGLGDSGGYQCAVDFGAKQVVVTPPVPVYVVAPEDLPVAGGAGVVLLGGLIAGAAALRMRRR